ncbi:MAG: hypothetical protein AAGF12_30645 [Myxococcota bacterium]
MSQPDTPALRSQIGTSLSSPPPGAVGLRILRFERKAPVNLADEFMDEVFGNDADPASTPRVPGRTIRWCGPNGANLSEVEVFPVRSDFEDALLVLALDQLTPVELWIQPNTLLDGPRLIERWTGSAGDSAGYREGPAGSASAQAFRELGFDVTMQADGLIATRTIHRSPLWFLWIFVPLAIWFIPLFLFTRDGRRNLARLGRSMFRGGRNTATYEIGKARLRMTVAGTDADGPVVEFGSSLRAVSFAPRGCDTGASAKGVLRLIGTDGMTRTPVELPGLSPEENQAVGNALKRCIEDVRGLS